MATFTFGRTVDIHWNGFEVAGPAGTVFSIPDQLYEEFNDDIFPVEPTLVWIDTNEFLTLSNSVSVSQLQGTFPISVTTTTSGRDVSISSSTNPAGYTIVADGTGGVIFQAASTGALTSVVGVSPISAIIAGNAASVSIDQSLITGATAATNAQVVRFLVKNTTGTTIPKGSAVYVSGATGDNALISLASATSEATSSKTLGITAEAIANDAFGYVIEAGYLTDIDTSATTAGAAVWLGNTPGSIVFVSPPAEPSHAVYLGVVVRVQSNNGSILVKVQNGYELDELHDVSAASPTDLDILQYKSSSSLWTKASIANAGIASSVHTHDYQASGTYVNSVIGTSPASVSTSSGTSTVSIVAGSINSTHLSATSVGSSQLIASSVGTAAISSGAATSGQVLQANGSGGVSFATQSVTVTGNSVIETLTGSGTWTVPSGVNNVDVVVIGSGGGGGAGGLAWNDANNAQARGGAGGASGRIYIGYNIYIGNQSSISYSVGLGGSGGAASSYAEISTTTKTDQSVNGADGADGGTTTFGSLISVPGGGGGGGGLTTLISTAPVTSAGGSHANFNAGRSPAYPTLSKGPSAGGSSAAQPSFASGAVSDWFVNGIVHAGSESYQGTLGFAPVTSFNSFVSISSGAATVSTNLTTSAYSAGISASTDTSLGTSTGPSGGAGGGRGFCASSAPSSEDGANTSSPSGPGGGGFGAYISSSTRSVTATAGSGGNATDYRTGGGGGGGGIGVGSDGTTNATSAAINLTSGAGGKGSDAIMYLRYTK